VLNKTFSI